MSNHFILLAVFIVLLMGQPASAKSNKSAETKPKQQASLIEKPQVIRGLQNEITDKIYNDIFDKNNMAGNYQLPAGASISFVRRNGKVMITIVDTHGLTNEITVPDA